MSAGQQASRTNGAGASQIEPIRTEVGHGLLCDPLALLACPRDIVVVKVVVIEVVTSALALFTGRDALSMRQGLLFSLGLLLPA